MKPTEYLFELINKSNISLLGYTTKEERIKDEIISNLGRTKTIDLSSSFSMKSIIRDMNNTIDAFMGGSTPLYYTD